MDLSNLQPAKGSVKKNNKRLGRGEGSGSGGTASRGHIMAPSREAVIQKRSVLKEARCHFNDESLSSDLRTQTES